MFLNIFVFFICFLFCLGQLGRISFLNQAINFYLYEVFLVIFFIYLFVKLRFKPLRYFYKKFPIFFYFFGWLLVSYLIGLRGYSLQENLIGFLYLARVIFYGGFGGYVGYEVKENPSFKKVLQKGIMIIIVITIITGIIQYFLYPDLRNLYYAGWDPHLNRMFGLFFDTSVAAAVYGMLFLYFIIIKKFPWLQLLLLICLILTFSRSTYLAIIFIIIINFITQKDYKKLFLILGLFLAIFFLAPKQFGLGVGLNRFFSIESRINDYRQAIFLWKKSPLIGFGYNRIAYLKEKYHLLNTKEIFPQHALASFSSSYLVILVGSGILGLLGMLGVLGRMWQINEKARPIIVFLSIVSLTDNIILHPFIMFIVTLLFYN